MGNFRRLRGRHRDAPGTLGLDRWRRPLSDGITSRLL